MRIVFLTNSIGFGGAEKMITCVANGMAKRGHFVAIVNYKSAGGEYINKHQQDIDKSISVYEFQGNKAGKISRLQKILFTRRVVKEFDADVMICFTMYPSFVGKIVQMLTGIPSIMSERGNPYATINKKNFNCLIELFVVNQSAGGVFQIKGASDFFSTRLQKKSTIIPNPIFIKDKIEQVQFEQREKSIVSVGRLDNYQKRYDIMIKAFSLFSKNHPEWLLKLYGVGSDEQLIKNWCIENGVEDRVKFMGLSKQPMVDICNAGMFLITSDFEGISNSLLEAMAVGLPCVSTDSPPGGARMLIQNNSNGLLAEVGNHEKIAEAMAKFADDPNLAKQCGENAKLVVSRFDAERTLDKWESYIAEVVNRN